MITKIKIELRIYSNSIPKSYAGKIKKQKLKNKKNKNAYRQHKAKIL